MCVDNMSIACNLRPPAQQTLNTCSLTDRLFLKLLLFQCCLKKKNLFQKKYCLKKNICVKGKKANWKHREVRGFLLCMFTSNICWGQKSYLTPHCVLRTQHRVLVMQGTNDDGDEDTAKIKICMYSDFFPKKMQSKNKQKIRTCLLI